MVEVNHLNLCYANKEEVLHDIHFHIAPGECVLFTGKSGSGKSSIIHAINGLAMRYDGAEVHGNICIDAKEVRNLELYQIAQLICSVFQNPKTHFFNVNTTLELVFYLENMGLAKQEMDARLQDMLALFPISHLLNRDIFKLSGGEKQILCIAASYIAGVKRIVLDEPSSNLDAQNIEVISNMLAKLKAEGITLILCEHRLYYLMDIVDRVFLVQEGSIVKEYPIADFLQCSTENLHQMGLRDKVKTKLHLPPAPPQGDLVIQHLDFENLLHLQNIAMQTGCIYGVCGNNGLGKSTFLRCIIGIEKKSKENIVYRGKVLSKKERLKISALVMQDVNHQLFSDKVSDELTLGMDHLPEGKEEAILQSLDLLAYKDKHPMSLSGGQKQRLAIASVLCQNASFLCFDEPTSGMDYANMRKISNLIKQYKENRIIIIVSHDIEFLNATADYIIQLKT